MLSFDHPRSISQNHIFFGTFESLALGEVELRINFRTISTFYGVHPQPIRTCIKNHFKRRLLASDKNLSKYLDVLIILQVLRDQPFFFKLKIRYSFHVKALCFIIVFRIYFSMTYVHRYHFSKIILKKSCFSINHWKKQ